MRARATNGHDHMILVQHEPAVRATPVSTPGGRLTFVPVDQHPLGDSTVPLWLPDQAPEHLIVVMDGNRAFRCAHETGLGGPPIAIESVVADLIAEGAIPPSAILGMTFRRVNPKQRQPSLSGDRIANFLFDRCLPQIASDCGIPVEQVTLTGASGGANASAQVLVLRPERVKNALLFCPGQTCFQNVDLASVPQAVRPRVALHSGGRDLPGCLDGVLAQAKRLVADGRRSPEDFLVVIDWEAFHGFGSMRRCLPVMLGWAGTGQVSAGKPYLQTLTDDPARPLAASSLGAWNRVFLSQPLSDGIDMIHVDAHFATDAPPIVSVEDERLRAQGMGTTTLRATSAIAKAERRVHVAHPSTPVLPCPELQLDPQDPARWPGLSHTVTSQDDQTLARFAVFHDARELHCCVEVRDRHVVCSENSRFADANLWSMAWNPELHRRDTRDLGRSGIEVWLDARPQPLRRNNRGTRSKADPIEHVLCTVGVGPDGRSDTPDPAPPRQVPRAECRAWLRTTPTGYRACISVPLACLNEMQGGQWQGFRLNLGVLQFGPDPLDRPSLHWCQPHWPSVDNRVGSGEFARFRESLFCDCTTSEQNRRMARKDTRDHL